MGLKDEAWRLSVANYPVRAVLQTRYGDMDPNAHLNNVAIARLVEEARVRFHHDLHKTARATQRSGVMIVHVAMDYLGEGFYPEDVESGVGIVSVGGSSYRLAIGLFQQGKAFVLAESVMVNAADGKAAAITDELRALLERAAVSRNSL